METIKLTQETKTLAEQTIKMFGKYGFTELNENPEDENHYTIENPKREMGYVCISSGIYETYEYDEDLNETTIPPQRWFVVESFGGRGELLREKTLEELLKGFLTLDL